jgi:hypothetical protein
MNNLEVPEFETYEEEATFWDNLDTADFMEDDGEWFHFETENQRAARVAILPEVLNELSAQARAQGVSIETLVNAWLIEHLSTKASGTEERNK